MGVVDVAENMVARSGGVLKLVRLNPVTVGGVLEQRWRHTVTEKASFQLGNVEFRVELSAMQSC